MTWYYTTASNTTPHRPPAAPPLTGTYLLAAEPAGEAALGLSGALLDLAVRGVNLLQRLMAGVFAVLLELVLSIRDLLAGGLSLRGGLTTLYNTARAWVRTALSSLAPACEPHFWASFSASFLTSVPRPGSSPLILDEARERSPIDRAASGRRALGRRGDPRTLELLLGGLGASACGVEVVTHATGGGETEVEGDLGLWLSH
jgi:hypothetical protein